MHQLLLQLIEIGITFLVPIVVKFVLTKVQIDKLAQAKAYASIAVAAVEQTMSTADAQAKKDAAIKKLSELTKGALSPEEIDHLVEDAVFNLKQQIAKSEAIK